MPLHDRGFSIIEFACLDEISRRSVFRSPCGDDEVDEVVEGSDREMIDFEEEGELASCSSFGRPSHTKAPPAASPVAVRPNASQTPGSSHSLLWLAPATLPPIWLLIVGDFSRLSSTRIPYRDDREISPLT